MTTRRTHFSDPLRRDIVEGDGTCSRRCCSNLDRLFEHLIATLPAQPGPSRSFQPTPP